MKKLFVLSLTLFLNSIVLFGQTAAPGPTYTYYPLFSEEWLGNKNFSGSAEYPAIMTIGSQMQGQGEFTDDFNSYVNTTRFYLKPSTTQNENAECALRCELLGFQVEAEHVAINIKENHAKAARVIIDDLHATASFKKLSNLINQNWDNTTSFYSVDPSQEKLMEIYTLLAQCKDEQLAVLVAAAKLTSDELANYTAFRTLQSTIDPKNFVTLDQFQFSSLEYLNVLLARRVSVANGSSSNDGFAELNETLLHLNLNAPDHGSNTDHDFESAGSVDCITLTFNADQVMNEYEYSVAPLIAW